MPQILIIGTRLEFELLNDIDEKIGYSYVSQLTDIIDDSNVAIAAPIHENRMIFIPLHAKIKVIFVHDALGLLTFTGTVSSKGHRDNIAVLFVHIDSPVQKIQRRKNFRLACILQVQYTVCPPPPEDGAGADTSVESSFKKAVSKNLSASGICIVTDEEIPKGSILKLSISLSKDITVETMGVAMRSREQKTGNITKYVLGIYFKDLPSQHEESITKFIFDKQRLLLQNTHKK